LPDRLLPDAARVGQPEYACAALRDPRGRWLLELRPATSRHAGDRLTCFGGRREPGEDAASCVRRELGEELGWCPERLEAVLELWDDGRFIAAFYCGQLPDPMPTLRVLPGHVAILVPDQSLAGVPLSPWHGLVIAALRGGRQRVDLAQEAEQRRGPPSR
jgi:8-oxo-dGTP diphosphatase